jgi:hypothetical protein
MQLSNARMSTMQTKQHCTSLILLTALAALSGHGLAQSTTSGYTFKGGYPTGNAYTAAAVPS